MKYHMMVRWLGCLLAIATGSLAGQKLIEPIKVFVFTAADPQGFVDTNSQQRSDSVEDLKKDLSKNSFIQIVPEQSTADVTLEVLGRGRQETGSTTSTYSYGQWHTYPDTVRVVRVGLRAGTYITLFEGTSSFAQRGLVGVSHGLWRVAANNAAKGIENWIKANHDNLISRRSNMHLTMDLRKACDPDTRTSECRAAAANNFEFGLQQSMPDAKISVGGPDNDAFVVVSQMLFDDRKNQGREFQNKMAKLLCVYGFKRIAIVSPSNMAQSEYELNCSTDLPASNFGVTARPEPAAAYGSSSPRPARGWIGLFTSNEGNASTTVARVVPGSPAAKAGIQVGDVLTQINDETVTSGDAFESRVARCKPGSEIRVRYMRGYWLSQATITVGQE